MRKSSQTFLPSCPSRLRGSLILIMVSEVKTVSGRAVPLIGNDIDTDRIIPARYLKAVTFDGLGEGVFIDDRKALNGEHTFDQPQYQGAKILIVNRNFGCGSSREHAPQALAKWGIQAVIGESFAEIFFGNCVAMGIPCVTADNDAVKQLQDLVAANPQTPVTIDLEKLQAQIGDYTAPIFIGEGTRSTFISGTWDACGQLVANADKVQAIATKLPYVGWGKLAAS
ncbi:3-isopropylmalate dehydratase, small subunit [Cylindrospermum stagnale PCC 7417]|uniref:3-isopropylmalate dehydratase small subunit n=2 Tax=Cylindrospermum stagnale TaxID=142864 RepID=K9X5K3_9NOST|nr:3-isopropylmalate dehydratase, small subunit [Cylindrospermum stagnale PCC 7417]